MNFPAGALNDPRAPFNRPYEACDFLIGIPVGREQDGSIIYGDADCHNEDVAMCPACARNFCERHAALDKKLMGCYECETEGTLFLCSRCEKTIADFDIAWQTGNQTCICLQCAEVTDDR